ncbi:LLM class flavin-dependent oxidoreductase, partial [Paenibacillus sp. IB182496]
MSGTGASAPRTGAQAGAEVRAEARTEAGLQAGTQSSMQAEAGARTQAGRQFVMQAGGRSEMPVRSQSAKQTGVEEAGLQTGANAAGTLLLTAGLDTTDYEGCLRMARAADEAGLHGLLAPEIGAAPGVFEPLALLGALASATRRIGLLGEVHAAYHEPYHVARKLAALDYISGGRAGALLMAGPSASAARFGREAERGADCAAEFAEALKALWDSWEDDALVYDQRTGVRMHPHKVREIDHNGRYYAVKGPLNIARPPQGYPPLLASLDDAYGLELAAREADAALVSAATRGAAARQRGRLQAELLRGGR